MKPRVMSFMVKASAILIAILGILICAFWYPFSISLSVIGAAGSPTTAEHGIEFYTQLIFFWVVSIPCFIILFFVWRLGNFIGRDELFCTQTVSIINRCLLLFLSDLALFLIGNVVFLLLGWNRFAIVYFGIAVVGLIITCIFAIAAHYLSKAAALQEEVDCTL